MVAWGGFHFSPPPPPPPPKQKAPTVSDQGYKIILISLACTSCKRS
ncbi:hypothetical protein ACN9O0_12005 [Glaesserella parasuis]